MDPETKSPILHSASLHAVAVFTCICGQTPLVLTGVSDVKTCPGCHRRYMVSTIDHKPLPNGTFETNVQIGLLNELAVATAQRSPLEIRRMRS